MRDIPATPMASTAVPAAPFLTAIGPSPRMTGTGGIVGSAPVLVGWARRTRLSQREAPRPTLPVGDLLSEAPSELTLRLLAGRSGLKREITIAVPERPGLALTGQPEALQGGAVQVLGKSEVLYLGRIPDGQRRLLLQRLGNSPIPCLLLPQAEAAHPDLVDASDPRPT